MNKIIIVLPYIRAVGEVRIGNVLFKGFREATKEPQEVKEELGRIISFFRQKETRPIDAFAYLIIEGSQEQLAKELKDLQKSLEVYRYFTNMPDRGVLSLEHTSVYVFIPNAENPRVYEKNEKHYMYRVTENFSLEDVWVTHPHGAQRPRFYKDVYGQVPPHIEDNLIDTLLRNISETDLRAISWYNKIYSVNATDSKENLLRLSVAFESFFSMEEETGRTLALSEIEKELSANFNEEQIKEIKKIIKPRITSLITRRLADEVEKITGSKPIKNWFSKHFYSVGSGIRHGDDVAELPKPILSKNKEGKSLWYGERASHGFLNNVYFGKRLFKFILNERYIPSEELLKGMEVSFLEALLVSDEERLGILEENIKNKKVGKIDYEDIKISFSFNRSYYGTKLRIFILLKRLLQEVKVSSTLWKKISDKAEILINADLSEEDINDYNKFNPYIHALIDIDVIFSNEKDSLIYDRKNIKIFYIKQFVSFSLNRLI